MINKNLIFKLGYLTVIGLGIFLLFFVITATWIGYEVKTQCKKSQQIYSGNCVESLSTLLDDNNRSFSERNSSIWALGQIGDIKALPVLEKYYTGNIPNREPLNQAISQYELEKAIKLVEGGPNITAIFWRRNIVK